MLRALGQGKDRGIGQESDTLETRYYWHRRRTARSNDGAAEGDPAAIDQQCVGGDEASLAAEYVAPSARKRVSESVGAMAAITPSMCSRTACQSMSGSGRRTPNRPAARAAWAVCEAASSALLGIQPKFRQSPPMRSRSISTTWRPSCAATAVMERPEAPAPTTARSKSGTGSLPSTPDDRQQRQCRKPDQRPKNAR